MIARLIESKIRKALDRKKIVTVLGPRQAGKSTLAGVVAKAEADRILELNGDDSDVRTMFEDTDETRIRTLIGNHDFLLVDEAQKIINVGNMLKIIADRFPDMKIPDMKVIATGSSSFKLAKAVNESLTGRKLEFRLYPLSFKEMVGHTNLLEERRLIAHRMIYGYYPEVVSSPGNEKEILKELIDSYLYKDVLEENSIGRPDRLVKLLQALAFQIGSTVSSNELAGLVGIDAKTVDRYINILERNFIIFTLPSYASNQRNELKFSRKLYFWDLGIRNAVIGNMAPLELRPPEEAGHLWENFLVSERIKRNDYAGRTFVKHYFWRTQQKKEVDLIEIEDGRMSAFEFKWKPGKAVAAPRQFAAQYNNAEFNCITPSEIGDFLQ